MHSFLTPDLAKGGPIDISAIYLQYPMLRYYKRNVPEDGLPYMTSNKLLRADIKKYGDELWAAANEWRLALVKANTFPHNIDIQRPWAPLGMSAGFISSTHPDDLWKYFFQNNNKNLTDIMERLEDKEPTTIERRAQIPNFYVYHGTGDTNCSIQDTIDAINWIKGRYENNKFEYKENEVNKHIYFNAEELRGVTHGFDHNISVKDPQAGFLRAIHEKLKAVFSP
jgi:hypothetical protein